MTKAEKAIVHEIANVIVELNYQAKKLQGEERKTVIAARNIFIKKMLPSSKVEDIVKENRFIIS